MDRAVRKDLTYGTFVEGDRKEVIKFPTNFIAPERLQGSKAEQIP
jgi:hypothetical protein